MQICHRIQTNLLLEPDAMIDTTATIYPGAKIIGKERLELGPPFRRSTIFVFLNAGRACRIGAYVHIASFVSVIGGGTFEMGDFSGLSAGVRIITGSDDFTGGSLTNPTVPSQYTNVTVGEVGIGRHAIIGTNVVIMPNVHIGEGAAVGAGCVVRKDLEPWTVYAGFNPKPVGNRDREGILAKEAALREEEGQ